MNADMQMHMSPIPHDITKSGQILVLPKPVRTFALPKDIFGVSLHGV